MDLFQNKIKVVDEQIQQSDHHIETAQQKMQATQRTIQTAQSQIEKSEREKVEAKAVKAEYEERTSDLRQQINEAQVLWDQENEYWLVLINGHLQKRQINNLRYVSYIEENHSS